LKYLITYIIFINESFFKEIGVMKKIILSVFLIIGLVFIASSVFAYSYSGLGIQPLPEIDPLNEYKNDDGFNKINSFPRTITGFNIMQDEPDPSLVPVAIILNLVPSFGLGSFIQGNSGAGWLQFWLEGIPVGLGFLLLYLAEQSNDPGGSLGGAVLGIYMIVLGWGIGAVIGIASPLLYVATAESNKGTGLIFTGNGFSYGFHF
jgi:hypothetical protein